MLTCKRKKFKRFLFLSFAFLVFSVCCSFLTNAKPSKVHMTEVKQTTQHVRGQQKKIIRSLERLERRLPNKKVTE
jgi:hypothetical protein